VSREKARAENPFPYLERVKKLLKQFVGRDAHPVVQFLKYGIAGVIATVVDIFIFYFLSLVVFPGIAPDDTLITVSDALYQWVSGMFPAMGDAAWFHEFLHFDVEPITEAVRKKNYLINKLIVFFISNFVAYLLNMLWVFHPGKHTRRKEIAMFYVVAVTSFVIGTALSYGLIHFFHVDTTQARVADVVVAVMINFFCRKFFVFAG
jgi:putative flippase GtrA